MGFKDKYTTEALLSKYSVNMETSMVKLDTSDVVVDNEVDKIVLSNDAYAIGELLETLINTMRR